MTRNAFNPDVGNNAEFPKLKARFNEDPSRFLQSSKDLAEARIQGIRNPELLEAYRAVARNILSGSDLEDAFGYIDDRERELTGDEPEPTPTAGPTPEPVATDGGTVATTADEPAEPTRDELHPDTKGLAAGEVLALEHAGRTDYIFPATEENDEPYLLRAFDGDDERTDEPIGLTFDEVAKRIDGSHDPKPVSEIDVDAPSTAALGGDL